MKNLKDSIKDAILEKLKVDDIVLEKLSIDSIIPDNIELPKNLDCNKLLNILQECGFKEVVFKDPSFYDIKTAFDNAHTKIYSCFGINGNGLSRIRFADTSEEPICGKNHILTYCPKSSIQYFSEYDHYYQLELSKSNWYEKANQLLNR